MDLPSSAPVGGLIDRSATHVVPSQSEVAPDQAKYLHHAGSPWFLALTALGVVYGDIGTSPLYAFQVALAGIGHSLPTAAEVLGIVSLIFWAPITTARAASWRCCRWWRRNGSPTEPSFRYWFCSA